VKVTTFHTENKDFEKFYQTESDFTLCKDVDSLLAAMNMKQVSEEWRLFIHTSKISLKAVLLHNGSKLPSIPIAHSVNTKETHETINNILLGLHYQNYEWQICGDLKVTTILLELRKGFTKYYCFLCE
jgi:hypothetical protein